MIFRKDLTELEEPVIKFTICDLENAETNSYNKLKHLEQMYSMAVSGLRWLDITPKSVNKGEALKYVLNFLGISAENVQAFGDYFNDKEMLQVAGRSYLMKNAHPGMQNYAKKISPYGNNEGGVVIHINEELKNQQMKKNK